MNKFYCSTQNLEFDILSCIGEGTTSKVYLARSAGPDNNNHQVAIKIFSDQYRHSSEKSIEKEIEILGNASHQKIVHIICHGTGGKTLDGDSVIADDVYYIMTEYVAGGSLFDFVQEMGCNGEDTGRFFFSQLLDVVEDMHCKGVTHRDLKLENILLDDLLNIKVADFGFASNSNIDKLWEFFGSHEYMAPEIKDRQLYNGRQTDIFSLGVILFTLVVGNFPFHEASMTDPFYRILLVKNYRRFWDKTAGQQQLSGEFKDLMVSLLSKDASARPTMEQIRNHPWMQEEKLQTREHLLDKFKTHKLKNQSSKI